jgi:hypothetical protein
MNPLAMTKKAVFCIVCILLVSSLVCVVSAQTTTVRATSSSLQPHVGDTVTVNITISNVQNLFGVDVTFNWNTAVLKLISAKSLLGDESIGVLHQTSSYPLYVVSDLASQDTGEYSLVATSTGSAPAFSGNGIIATLKFNVTSQGAMGLQLDSDLSDHPAAGQTSNFITHTDTVDQFSAIPEYQNLIVITTIMALASAALVVSKKHLNKKEK